MNDIMNGVVDTGWDACTVCFVFVSICCGMVRLTNARISQQIFLGFGSLVFDVHYIWPLLL